MRPHKKPIDQIPSKILTKYAEEIAVNTQGIIADVACGYGRNALYLSSWEVPILCIDNNIKCLEFIDSQKNSLSSNKDCLKLLETLNIDLINDSWPFEEESLGAIINVHFITEKLFDNFLRSLKIDGYLLIETIGGHGGNYLSLLPQGYIKSRIVDSFEIKFFQEKKVGPQGSNAATFKLFAIKRKPIT